MRYDVAVIGAGPAGAVFARELGLANPSIRILLVDGQTEERPKVCGGLLAPDAQKLLAEFSLTLPNHLLANPQIFSVETLDLTAECVRHYQRHYLNMDRARFDRWLISLIPDTVERIAGRCFSLEEEADGYAVGVLCGEVKHHFNAASIVGADGAGSMVRRKFFGRPLMQYVAIQQWFAGKEKLPAYSCIFDRETSDSCSWTVRKDPYFIFGGAFPKQGCRAAFTAQRHRVEAFLGEEFGEAYKTEACLLSSPRKLRDMIPGKAGVYLVGEAAGFISSSSFEGISNAMASGKVLAAAYLRGGGHENIIAYYRRRTRQLRLKLWGKMQKRRILCSPFLRAMIMRSGVAAVKTERILRK